MAPVATAVKTEPVQTLPQLLVVNKDFTRLTEQIDHVTRIIGLPEDWSDIREEDPRLKIIDRLVRARAEWVLRWILDKLRDETNIGVQARADPKAWQLLDWMLHTLPTSRSTGQLREADLLSLLEKALQENLERSPTTELKQDPYDSQLKDVSESSETVQEDPPSRKRKRPSSGASTPSKRVISQPGGLERLFGEILAVMRSIADKAQANDNSEEVVHNEHMKMIMRTETAQAARILKLWLTAVHKLIHANSGQEAGLYADYLEISGILQIWEIRTIDGKDDSGASIEQFSTECLVPTLILHSKLLDQAKRDNLGQNTRSSIQAAIKGLERLLIRHLFAPSRAAFFAEAAAVSNDRSSAESPKAKTLASNLDPLRAKILQAAQVGDTGAPIPDFFLPLFSSIPQILDLAIETSPFQTPKSRITEQPWIQAVFVALAQCAGCSLDPPEHPVPNASLDALQKLIGILAVRGVRINAEILADLFWFHAGIKYPLNHKRHVQWPFVAAMVQLDPDLFVTTLSNGRSEEGRPDDLARVLFNQISSFSRTEHGSPEEEEMDADNQEHAHAPDIAKNGTLKPQAELGQDELLQTIIVPIMSAFAKHRDLLGFIRRWDTQLCANAPIVREVFKELKPSIWEDRRLRIALAELFEKSLTPTQISGLFRHHARRLKPPHDTNNQTMEGQEVPMWKAAYSSATLLRALLESIVSDETIEKLEPQLQELLNSFSSLVQDERYRSRTDLASCWLTLCRLLVILWPLHLHGSFDAQNNLVRPIIDRAIRDVSTTHKKGDEVGINSRTRAAALLFLLVSCDHLRTVPGWDTLIREGLRKSLKALSPGSLEPSDMSQMVVVFCTEFAQLLDYLEPETRQKSLHSLLTKISELDDEVASHTAHTLSESLFSSATAEVRDAYSAALMAAVDDVDEHESLRNTAEIAASQIRPPALAREQREAVLDKMFRILVSRPENPELVLAIMMSLQQIPNTTAKISSDGAALFDIAQSLHDNNLESASALYLFQELVRWTLEHILPNKSDQARMQQYHETFQGKLSRLFEEPHECFPARLAILRAAFLVQKHNELLPWNRYSVLLSSCLDVPCIPQAQMLLSFNQVPAGFFDEHADEFQAAQTALRAWLQDKIDFEAPINQETKMFRSPVSLGDWSHYFALLVEYQLYPNAQWLVKLSIRLLQELAATGYHQEHQNAILELTAVFLTPLATTSKLTLLKLFIHPNNEHDQDTLYRLLHVLISTLEDRLEDDDEQRKTQLSILPTVCTLLAKNRSASSFNNLMDTMDTIILKKPSLTSQHNIESVLTALVKLSSRNSPQLPFSAAPAIYKRLCDTTRVVLSLHRSRLGGRFHLLLPLLQNLLFCLFIPHAGRGNTLPHWLKPPSPTSQIHLTSANASRYARLLATLCSPTHSSVSKIQHHHRPNHQSNQTKSSLNDPIKTAKEYVSHYVYPLLASFCRYQLSGRLLPDIREKLMPAMWDVVGVANMDRDAVDAMFAGLDNASRDIWRGVWEDWRREFGRRDDV